MSEEIKIIKEKPKTYNLIASHPLQSWEWGEFREAQGHKVVRLGVAKNNRLTQVYQLTFHRLLLVPLVPLVPLTIGYLPKSPLPSKEVIEELRQIGKENKAIFIKIEPNEELQSYKDAKLHREIERLRLVSGKPLFTKYTSVIDLNRTEEEIFNSFKPKTRYNIRLSEKHGVGVQEDNSDKAFEKYLDLLFETTSRQGFYAHNKEYHRNQWQILKPAGISHLLTATYQGQILSAFLLFVFNDTLYYPYGASTREHKELMAPTLLMWEAIRFGKKMGCKKFDLWGDVEPNPPPNHPYFGFHRFKEGFSPRLVEFVGSYDLVINPTFYQIYKIIDKLRWKILRLKSQSLSR